MRMESSADFSDKRNLLDGVPDAVLFEICKMSNLYNPGHAGPPPTDSTTRVCMASALSVIVSVISIEAKRISLAIPTG
jgi:hypothetical protein